MLVGERGWVVVYGWSSFHSIWRPQHGWVSKWWPYKLDLWVAYRTPLLRWINRIIIPMQESAYRFRYKQAIKKWPHLREEILGGADWRDLLEGL